MKLLRDTTTTTRTLRTTIDTSFAQLQQFALVDESPQPPDAADEIAVDLQSATRSNPAAINGDDVEEDGEVNMNDELRAAMQRALAAVRNAKAQRSVQTTIVVSDDEEEQEEESIAIQDHVNADPLILARRQREAAQREYSQLDDEITSRERQIARLRAEIDSLHSRRRELAPTLFALEASTGSWHS